jgi:mono/diheme cytochrome c family protein
MAYENWTKVDAGGTGSLPEGVVNQDYIRCKACHGWDHQGTDGGYVRRSRKDTRPNAGAGDGDGTSRVILSGAVTADQVLHAGTGRTYAEGTGSWVAKDEMHSASNTAAHANGYTLGNQHPDFSTGGMTQDQADCLAEFLNFEDGASSAYFANINPSQDPVLYTIIESADAAAGEAFYGANCAGCHSADPADESGFDPGGGMLAYLGSDGKFSEFSHKVRWGIPDKSMTRAAMGSPTSADVANVMLWLQQEGGTGFAANSGLTGTWWNSARSGEGFVLDFGTSNGVLTLFGSFYTFDDMGNQVWLTAQSTTINGAVVTVDVFITNGPMWGDAFDPADANTVLWGTGTFTFPSCTAGSVALVPSAEMMAMGFTDYMQNLTRDAIESGIGCPTPNAN